MDDVVHINMHACTSSTPLAPPLVKVCAGTDIRWSERSAICANCYICSELAAVMDMHNRHNQASLPCLLEPRTTTI
jgi:hypothetical protein